MAEEKLKGLQWPADSENIPAPVVTSETYHVAKQRRARVLKFVLGGAAVLFLLHTFACGRRPHRPRQEELQIADGLATHSHGHKPLRGKAAEALYL